MCFGGDAAVGHKVQHMAMCVMAEVDWREGGQGPERPEPWK